MTNIFKSAYRYLFARSELRENMGDVRPGQSLATEQTKSQNPPRAGAMGDIFGASENVLGKAPTGHYKTYRKMRTDPQVALARAVLMLPIRMAEVTLEKKDDSVPDEQFDFIKSQMDPLYPKLIKDMLFGLDYGWAPFEKVFEITEGNNIGYKKLKPLLVDNTKIKSEENGNFAGFRQGKVDMDAEKCFLFTYDKECDNWYGRSQMENIRESTWWPRQHAVKKYDTYLSKVAGTIPIVQYPEGEGRDENNVQQSNYYLAMAIIDGLSNSQGVAVPKNLSKYADDLIRMGYSEAAAISDWVIEFLESKGQHGKEMLDGIKYYDSGIFRGYFVPERAATEGEHGTKAEAETHGRIAELSSTSILFDMLQHINDYLINHLLILNFGDDTCNNVFYKRSGLDSQSLEYFRDLTKAVLSNPNNTELFLNAVAVEALLDAAAVPVNPAFDPEAQQVVQEGENLQAQMMSFLFSNAANGPY